MRCETAASAGGACARAQRLDLPVPAGTATAPWNAQKVAETLSFGAFAARQMES